MRFFGRTGTALFCTVALVLGASGAALAATADNLVADTDTDSLATPMSNGLNARQDVGTNYDYAYSAAVTQNNKTTDDVFQAAGDTVSATVTITRNDLGWSASPSAQFTLASANVFTAYSQNKYGYLTVTVPAATVDGTQNHIKVTITPTASNGQLIGATSLNYSITAYNDGDGDGVRDTADDCPTVANADQADADNDRIGDACDAPAIVDGDLDGVADTIDNCPTVANPDQADADGDGLGNACDDNSYAPAVLTPAVDATGNEGDTLGTSGVFSDQDANDTLAISKFSGDGTVADNGDGTWSWSLATTDDGSGTVVVQASDGEHAAATNSFDWSAANVAPAATIEGPATPPAEGTSFSVTLIDPSDPSSADAAALRYAFSCDGTAIATTYATGGPSSSTSCLYDDGPATQTVRARIMDKDGSHNDYFTTVSGTNVAPTATLGNNGPVNEGSAATISITNVNDPSSADTTAGLRYAFSCTGGDLSGVTYGGSGTSASTSCTFDDNGSHTVSGVIIDKDGGKTGYTTDVIVNNVAPTATLGNNGSVNEGSAATISFTNASDPSTSDTAAGFHYAFSCDDSSLALATYDGSGTSASTSCTFDDNGSHTVSGVIIDKNGGKTGYTKPVTVNNVAPTIGTLTVNGGTSTACLSGNTVSLGFSFTDPAGSHDQYTGSINWGDRSPATSFSDSPVSATHTYGRGLHHHHQSE